MASGSLSYTAQQPLTRKTPLQQGLLISIFRSLTASVFCRCSVSTPLLSSAEIFSLSIVSPIVKERWRLTMCSPVSRIDIGCADCGIAFAYCGDVNRR